MFYRLLFDKRFLILPAILLTLCCRCNIASAQATADQQYQTGLTSFNMGQYTSAIGQWEQLLAAYPNYAEKEKVWYSIAFAATQAKSFEKAATYYDKIINQVDAVGKPVRGNYYDLALYEAGIAFYNYAEQLRQQGDLTNAKIYALQAETFFNLLYETTPDSTNVPRSLWYLTRIAIVYKQSAVDTKTYAEKALQMIPENTTAIDEATKANQDIRNDCRFYYAWALGLSGQLAEARRIFGSFITSRDTKRGPTSLYELAQTYYREGKYSEALGEMSSYESLFPSDQSSRLQIQRLRAMCYYQLENYTQAAQLLNQLIQGLAGNASAILPEDYVWLILCYLKTKKYDVADDYLSDIERQYAGTVYREGVDVLRAGYHYETGNYQKAIDLINPILGTWQQTNGTVSFTKRPYNAETEDRNKCNLSEEHFLMAASLLSLCYAKGGQLNTGQAIYSAMLQISNEMYDRYSDIRVQTQAGLTQIAQSKNSGSSSGVVVLPPGTGIGTGTGTGTGNGSIWTSGSGSTIQPGGSNSLASRSLTAEQYEEEISRCATLAKRDVYVDEVLRDLSLLLGNPNVAEYKYNNARAAVLRGQLLFEKKKDTQSAMAMFELAYDEIAKTQWQDTDTFASAAYYMGKYAEESGKYENAAQHYSESLQTLIKIGNTEFQDTLLYRWGTTLLNVRGGTQEAILCFDKIYTEKTASKYWSHAAMQLAIDDFKNGDYEACEEIIDELIARKPDKAVLDRVLFLKGELALRNKQWDIATESFDALCVYSSESPFVHLASQRLSDVRSQSSQSTIR